MTALEILKSARKRIEKRECWCQGHSSTDKEGNSTFLFSPESVAWCATGAAEVVGFFEGDVFHEAMDALRDSLPLGWDCIPRFNDSSTHEEVLALFDRAIARLEEKS